MNINQSNEGKYNTFHDEIKLYKSLENTTYNTEAEWLLSIPSFLSSTLFFHGFLYFVFILCIGCLWSLLFSNSNMDDAISGVNLYAAFYPLTIVISLFTVSIIVESSSKYNEEAKHFVESLKLLETLAYNIAIKSHQYHLNSNSGDPNDINVLFNDKTKYKQSIDLNDPKPLKLNALNESLDIFNGKIKARGAVTHYVITELLLSSVYFSFFCFTEDPLFRDRKYDKYRVRLASLMGILLDRQCIVPFEPSQLQYGVSWVEARKFLRCQHNNAEQTVRSSELINNVLIHEKDTLVHHPMQGYAMSKGFSYIGYDSKQGLYEMTYQVPHWLETDPGIERIITIHESFPQKYVIDHIMLIQTILEKTMGSKNENTRHFHASISTQIEEIKHKINGFNITQVSKKTKGNEYLAQGVLYFFIFVTIPLLIINAADIYWNLLLFPIISSLYMCILKINQWLGSPFSSDPKWPRPTTLINHRNQSMARVHQYFNFGHRQ